MRACVEQKHASLSRSLPGGFETLFNPYTTRVYRVPVLMAASTATVGPFYLREKLGTVAHLCATPERGDRAREDKPWPAPDLATRVQERSGAFVRKGSRNESK